MLIRNILVFTLTLFSIRVAAQAVISANSGLILSSEGAVLIDGRTIARINGRFPELPKGSLLSTSDGKAEVLLGPGTFLWLGGHSEMRMQDSSLADARVELLEGSAVVQSTDVLPDNSVTLIYSGSQVHAPAPGLYRIDAAAAQISVLEGEANATDGQRRLLIHERHRLAFSSGLITPVPDSEPDDLDQWALERRLAISADNHNRARIETRANRLRIRAHGKRLPFPTPVTSFPGRI